MFMENHNMSLSDALYFKTTTQAPNRNVHKMLSYSYVVQVAVFNVGFLHYYYKYNHEI